MVIVITTIMITLTENGNYHGKMGKDKNDNNKDMDNCVDDKLTVTMTIKMRIKMTMTRLK